MGLLTPREARKLLEAWPSTPSRPASADEPPSPAPRRDAAGSAATPRGSTAPGDPGLLPSSPRDGVAGAVLRSIPGLGRAEEPQAGPSGRVEKEQALVGPIVPRVRTQPPSPMHSLVGPSVARVQSQMQALMGPTVSGMGQLQAALQQAPLKDLLDGLQRLAQAQRGARPAGRVAYPNKQKLSSVQDFFLYSEAEGRRLFQELDFDADGQVTLADLEHAMRRRRLPQGYAREMLRRVRRHWLAKSFGWPEFQALMEQKEPAMLRAFTSLSVSASGTLQKEQVLASLRRAGLPATEETARAMMRFLDADAGEQGQITYGQFRNFLLLLPPERLSTADPSMLWFEAATMVPVAPPAAGASVLRSALAGGLASGLSTCLMHPLDTIKTRVQASSATLGEVVRSVPKLGLRGVYAGAAPAILGQFASHGLRTGVFEASKMLISRIKPDLSEFQVQPVASLCSTVLGTAVRIPCEVLKQRLQAGVHSSVREAFVSTLREDGPQGFFRGTTATLLREVPFYVFGMFLYLQVKKAAKSVLRRELAPWEAIFLGGVSGGLAAVVITPFDVLKTRMMVAPKGSPSNVLSMGLSIVSKEGPMALYKGALPRFFWIAPLGAMNFAGYELAKQAMEEKQNS